MSEKNNTKENLRRVLAVLCFLMMMPCVSALEVTSANSFEFMAGEVGTVAATIMNTGESGNIEVYLECTLPFEQVGHSALISLNNNDSMRVSLPVSCSTDKPVSGICAFKACSLGECVSKLVAVFCDPIPTCEPEYVCVDNVWMKCNEYKTGRVEFMDCSDGYVCDLDHGLPVCSKPGIVENIIFDVRYLIAGVLFLVLMLIIYLKYK